MVMNVSLQAPSRSMGRNTRTTYAIAAAKFNEA
jgi:hypothetical protein